MMAATKLTIEPDATKTIYFSLEDSNPPISVNVTFGAVALTLSDLSPDATAKKNVIRVKAGETVIVRSAIIRAKNPNDTDSKCEFNLLTR